MDKKEGEAHWGYMWLFSNIQQARHIFPAQSGKSSSSNRVFDGRRTDKQTDGLLTDWYLRSYDDDSSVFVQFWNIVFNIYKIKETHGVREWNKCIGNLSS